MRFVTSENNPTLKLIRRLRTRKGRDRTGCYLVEGPKLLWEALNNRADIIHAVFCEEGEGEGALGQSLGEGFEAEGRGREALARALGGAGADVLATEPKLFGRLADAESPQGVLAVVRKPEPASGGGDWLILDRVQEPGNIGALMRTAAAAGFDAVITVKGSGDVYAPKAVRASAGAVFRMGARQAGDAAEAAEMARSGGRLIVAADPVGSRSIYETDLTGLLALVIGNEGGGLSPEFRRVGALMARIPMPGGTESLNAAAAAAVIMFEAVRQRGMGAE
ncbi:MAG: RNA methyltransferase [Clostridiales Family XIII bacterium]|jgi:TrmH family RNA methyltransferase|nr:RNA methyltransferase [Clostridiales Family XIII bacterium]